MLGHREGWLVAGVVPPRPDLGSASVTCLSGALPCARGQTDITEA